MANKVFAICYSTSKNIVKNTNLIKETLFFSKRSEPEVLQVRQCYNSGFGLNDLPQMISHTFKLNQ